jgi:predicted GNAT family N-acyltransferase
LSPNKGIGRRLFELSVKECLNQKPQAGEITVNASLYAQDIYRKLGFTGPGPETKKNGMIFVPLTYKLK